MHSLLLLLPFNEFILNAQGSKLIKNGYINEIVRLIIVFLIRNIWLFLNTAQKEDK